MAIREEDHDGDDDDDNRGSELPSIFNILPNKQKNKKKCKYLDTLIELLFFSALFV